MLSIWCKNYIDSEKEEQISSLLIYTLITEMVSFLAPVKYSVEDLFLYFFSSFCILLSHTNIVHSIFCKLHLLYVCRSWKKYHSRHVTWDLLKKSQCLPIQICTFSYDLWWICSKFQTLNSHSFSQNDHKMLWLLLTLVIFGAYPIFCEASLLHYF